MTEHWLRSAVDGEPTGLTVLLVADDQNTLYTRELDLSLLELPVPEVPRYRYQSETYVPVRELDGLTFQVNLDRFTVNIVTGRAPQTREAAPPARSYDRQPASRAWLEPEAVSEHRLRVVQNNLDTRLSALVLEHDSGNWLVRHKDLLELDLSPPDEPPIRYQGQLFYPFESLAPMRLNADAAWQVLYVDPHTSVASRGTDQLEESLLEVSVNEIGERLVTLALQDADNRIYLKEDVLEHFRLQQGDGRPVRRLGEAFYPVAELPGVRTVFNRRDQRLTLYAGAESFQKSDARARYGKKVEPDFGSAGAFLNYSLFGTSGDLGETLDGQFELGAFAGRGGFTSSHIARGLAGRERENIRLDSTVRLDWPQSMQTLSLGDAIGFPGAWGQPVRFGGIQWGTNFATQPGFITFPMPAIHGETALPSTVDVFVNNARRASEQLPPGPFTIRDVPVVTGSGDIRLVVRDVLGREQVVSIPFYASRQLLREGLHEYSYEVGKVREEFGIASDRYGRTFAAATHRYGLTDWFTGEIRTEVLRDQVTAGLAGDFLWPAVGEFHFSLAASANREFGRRGRLAEFGFRREMPLASFGFNVRAATEDFAQLGLQPTEPPDALQTRTFASLSLGGLGSLALSHVRQDRRTLPDTEFATLQFTADLGDFGHLFISALEPFSEGLERSISLSLSIPLGKRTAMRVGATDRESGRMGSLQIQRNLPAGRGFGYRLLTERGTVERSELGFGLRTGVSTISAQAVEADGTRAYHGTFDGAIGLLGGHPFLTRRVDQSFAVVEVPDMPNVDVYRDNQRVATTDNSGIALVPDLRAYQENPIRIEDSDLPLDVAVDSLEIQLIPGFRHGLKARFDIQRSHWVGFRLYTAQGEPLPAGTELREAGTGRVYAVGFEGQAYVQGKPGRHHYRARWSGRICQVVLEIPDTQELMPDLGRKICQ